MKPNGFVAAVLADVAAGGDGDLWYYEFFLANPGIVGERTYNSVVDAKRPELDRDFINALLCARRGTRKGRNRDRLLWGGGAS